MPNGQNKKSTRPLGESLVRAELEKRGFVAIPSAINDFTFEVRMLDGISYTTPIKVKASRSNNWPSDARLWMDIDFDSANGRQNFVGPTKITDPTLIHVCVAIAEPESNEPNRFFILTKKELQVACIKNYSDWMDKRDWIRPRNPQSYDARYWISTIEEYEDRWELIRERLSVSKSE